MAANSIRYKVREQQRSNEQSLHVGAPWVIFMTASRHGDKQICLFSRVSFLSESPTPNGLPKHSFIMAYRTVGLRDDVYQCHISSYGKLDQMGKVIHSFFDIIYMLNLFIDFIYSIWWPYLFDLVALFIGII